MRFFLSRYKFYEGEGGEGDGGDTGTGTGTGSGTGTGTGTGTGIGTGTGDSARRYTQEEVNRMIANDKKRIREENSRLLKQLEQINQSGLTPEARQELEETIERLQNEGKTKEQLANETLSKKEKQWKEQLDKTSEAATGWKSKYSTYRSKTEVLSCASNASLLGEHTAYNPEQIYTILKDMIHYVEEKNADGEPTGELIPRVKFPDVDKDNKPTVLDLTIPEAVKRMSDMEIHSNLFKSGATSGLGGGNRGRGRTSDGEAIPTTTAGFMAAWKKDKGKTLTREMDNANRRSK